MTLSIFCNTIIQYFVTKAVEMLDLSGRAYRIKRNYIYQFPNKQKDVIFEDVGFGYYYAIPTGIQVATQVAFSDKKRYQLIANEQISITNISYPEDTEVCIQWINAKQEVKREFIFKAGEQVLNAIPMIPGQETPCIQAGYKVSEIYFELGHREGFYLNVGFESFIPVLQDSGEIKYERFSQSCYEIEAEAVRYQ